MSRGEDNWNGEPRCEKQRLEEPPGSGEPLHTIFEEYADDQNAWMRDYVPAMEKMLANGYETGLVDAPDFTTGVKGPAICICTFPPFLPGCLSLPRRRPLADRHVLLQEGSRWFRPCVRHQIRLLGVLLDFRGSHRNSRSSWR